MERRLAKSTLAQAASDEKDCKRRLAFE